MPTINDYRWIDLLDTYKNHSKDSKFISSLEMQEGAWANCGEASALFRSWLKEELGIESQLVMLAGLPDFVDAARREHYEEGEFDHDEIDIHFVVRVGALYVDWTARQYRHNYAFPYICQLHTFTVEGWDVWHKEDNPTPEQDKECQVWLDDVAYFQIALRNYREGE